MNILIIRFTSLGDLVTLEPAFRAVRSFYPDANITFVTSSIGKGLYEDTDYFDEFVVHEKYKTTLSKITKKHYDLVFNFHCNSVSHILTLMVSKSKVVNSAASVWQKIAGIKIPVRPVPETIQKSGISEKDVEEYFSKEENKTISLPVNGDPIIKSKKKIIAFSTGSSETWKSKQWGSERYLKLIELLLKKKDVEILLVGTKLELEDSEYIQKRIPEVINYVDKSNLTQLKNLLNSADVFIGNDSGPAHIAASVGTNTITIFGPTSTVHCVKHIPYRGKHICIKPSENITCHPCYKGVCPTNLECMESILVEDVYNKILKLLKD
jgi:heptosyltransferase-2